MWADTEIRRDLIRGWRDEVVRLWREVYDTPPEPDGEDPEVDEWMLEAWYERRDHAWLCIAIDAMDLDLAREIDDICNRAYAEAAIHDRAGNLDAIAIMLELAVRIENPEIRSRTVAGICHGTSTPALLLELGLLGHALAIPSRFDLHRYAVAAVVEKSGRPELLRWVWPAQTSIVLASLAASTGDPAVCREALSRAFLESNGPQIRRSVDAIARTGDLALNEWAMREIFRRESANERALAFARLSHGPLRDWAREFAISTSNEIDANGCPQSPGPFEGIFSLYWRRDGWAREIALAELAVNCDDPSVTERMYDNEVRELTLATIGLRRGDSEPARKLFDPLLRAQALIECGRHGRDEAPIFEACRQLEKVEREEDRVDTLSKLMGVFSNLLPPTIDPAGRTPEKRPAGNRRINRRVHPEQLSLPLDG